MRKHLILILLTCLGSIGSRAAFSAPALTPESIQSFFDAAFKTQIQDHEIVGAVVSVVKDDATVFQKGYGWANLEERVPASAEGSLFRIASISKTFIWTAIMQLEEQGKLSLDDDVNHHLTTLQIPDTFDEPIRIRHLMSHTPGLEDLAVGMAARTLDQKLPLREYLAQHMPTRVRPAGSQASYSNWGTSLAGLIVENISGLSWQDYVDQHVLQPLAMSSTNTHTQMAADLRARHAASYTWGGGRFEAKPFTFLNDEPAGSMSTTAADMARFMRAHLNFGVLGEQRILAEGTARRMREELFAPHPGISPMLHGFYRADRNGQVIFGHGGDTNQFHSDMSFFPDHNLGVFVSFNSDPGADARSNLSRAFVDHFFPTDYLPQAPAAAQVSLSDYVGDYIPLRAAQSTFERLESLVVAVTMAAADDELSFNGFSRWVPVAEDRFTGRYTNSVMVFERADDGSVEHVMVNSPLSTYKKVTGLDAPSNQQRVLGLAFVIALFAVIGYGYRGVRPVGDGKPRLPRAATILAWVHCFLTVSLFSYLGYTLSGDVQDLVYGVSTTVHINLLLMALNVLLGLVVIYFAVKIWIGKHGAVLQRAHYSMVGLAALINLWFVSYFNIIAYPFS